MLSILPDNIMLPLSLNTLALEDMQLLAKKFMEYYLSQNTIYPITLSGVLGAGKSSFVKACLQYLSVLDSGQAFTSPSFTIINEYIMEDTSVLHTHPNAHQLLSLNPIIYHIDLYRLRTPREAENIGIFDIINQHICFIEWPENIQGSIPHPLYYISINIETEAHRSIHISLQTS